MCKSITSQIHCLFTLTGASSELLKSYSLGFYNEHYSPPKISTPVLNTHNLALFYSLSKERCA